VIHPYTEYCWGYHEIRISIRLPNIGKVLEEEVDRTSGAPA
jgi:hypothetical protein